MNVVKLSSKDLQKYISVTKLQQRSRRWFILGYNIATLLELHTGASILKALAQLLDEYEHWLTQGVNDIICI
jgi:hypothetical protein